MSYQNEIVHEDGKKAVIYVRVSTEEQVDNFSLGTQEEICRKEAEKRGYQIVEVFSEEGRSAKNISGRPVLIGLLEYSRKNKRKIQAVFVYRLDRVSRVAMDYLAIRKKLMEYGISVISATEPTGDTPTEKLLETMLAGFAQLDNETRSERSRNGLHARHMSGLIVSGYAPLGYMKEAGYAVKNPKTWDAVKKAWDLMATGSKSLVEIAKIMNEWGLRINHKDVEFKIRPQTASYIFNNKFYMGIMKSPTYKEEVRGQHVAMITEEQFYKVQAILNGRNTNPITFTKRVHSRPDFPLRRIVRCGKCGMGLTGGWSKGKCKKYAYYRCVTRGCKTPSIKVEDLEDSLIELLKKVTPKKECLDSFVAFLYKIYQQRASRLNIIKNESDGEITRLKILRKQLVEKNLSGIYSDEIFKEQNSIIEEKMISSQIAKSEATFDRYNIDEVISFLKVKMADLGETYKKSNVSQIKVLLCSIFTSELSWNYEGTLNTSISPIFQAIQTFDNNVIRSCAGERTRTPTSVRTHGPKPCASTISPPRLTLNMTILTQRGIT